MLSARCKTEDVLAWEVTKEDGPFMCPVCNDEVIIKKGRVKVHHFAHSSMESICPNAWHHSESEAHKRAKKEIYEALQKNPRISKLKLERWLGEIRPDISFCLGNIPIAIEVQISVLPLDLIDRRTKAYASKGVYLLWLSPLQLHTELQEGEKYNPRLWEKYIHTMYFGKVYYWLSDERLLPVHFDEYQIYVEESSWWEGEGEDAYERSEGGYYRKSRRYRTPRFLDGVKITDLSPVTRKSWSSKDISVPAARLWCINGESGAR